MNAEKGWSEDRIDGAISQEFNAAMSRLYGKELFIWARNLLLQTHAKEKITEEEIARFTGISQPTVSRWKKKGTLSIESLVTVLTKIGCEVAALPPLPSLQARMAEGYRGAMSWILGAELKTQDFIGFLSLWLEPDWRAYLCRLKTTTAQPEERRDLLAKLAPSVARTIGKYQNRKMDNVTIDYLDWVEAACRDAWDTCQSAIGYKWQIA